MATIIDGWVMPSPKICPKCININMWPLAKFNNAYVWVPCWICTECGHCLEMPQTSWPFVEQQCSIKIAEDVWEEGGFYLETPVQAWPFSEGEEAEITEEDWEGLGFEVE